MSLLDLVQYAAGQQQRINRLVFGYILYNNFPLNTTDRKHRHWEKFRSSLWQKGFASFEAQERVQRGDNPLGLTTPETCTVITQPTTMPDAWVFTGESRFLLRSEYYEAEKAVIQANANNKGAFLLSGQRGIGKSVFLLWLLMRRLAHRLPTALQLLTGEALLFHALGTSRFEDLNDVTHYQELSVEPGSAERIWVLVDSSYSLPQPAGIFRRPRPFFIVEAVSSRQTHLRWAEDFAPEYFYMKIWEFSEILQIRSFMGLQHGGPFDEDELWNFHDAYGACPRDLFIYSRNPDEYKDHLINIARGLRFDVLQHVLLSPDSGEISSLITIVEPSLQSRRVWEKKLASQGVFDILWNLYIKANIIEMERFYDLFQNSAATASAAGWLFESRMHQLLAAGMPIEIFRIGDRLAEVNVIYDKYKGTKGWVLQLPKSGQHLFNDGGTLNIGKYYLLPEKNFPAVDSLAYIQPEGETPMLLMIQITRNHEKHGVNPEGLKRINSLVLRSDSEAPVRKIYVVVTPRGIQPKITVPMSHFGDEVGNAKEIFPVFHCPIDRNILFPHSLHGQRPLT